MTAHVRDGMSQHSIDLINTAKNSAKDAKAKKCEMQQKNLPLFHGAKTLLFCVIKVREMVGLCHV
jgi:hypothetical protein